MISGRTEVLVPTLKGVRRDLARVQQGRGFHLAKFDETPHLWVLDAVKYELALEVPPPGGAPMIACSLVECMIRTGTFSRDYYSQLLKYTMNLEQPPGLGKDLNLSNRRDAAEPYVRRESGEAFTTAERYATTELVKLLIEAKRSPCLTGDDVPQPLAALAAVLGATMTGIRDYAGADELERLCAGILQSLKEPLHSVEYQPASATESMRIVFEALVRSSWSSTMRTYVDVRPRKTFLTTKSMVTYIRHWFAGAEEVDVLEMPRLTFGLPPRHGVPANVWRDRSRVALSTALRNSLHLLAWMTLEADARGAWPEVMATAYGERAEI